MLMTVSTRKPACLLARGGVRLRRSVRPDAFGNALGGAFVDSMQSPNQSAAETARLGRSMYEPDESAAETARLGRSMYQPDQSAAEDARLGRYESAASDAEYLQQSDYIQNRRLGEFTEARGNDMLIGMRNASIDAQTAQERAARAARAGFTSTTNNLDAKDIRASFAYRSVLSRGLETAAADVAYQARIANGPQMRALDGVSGRLPEEMSAGQRIIMGSFEKQAGQNLAVSGIAAVRLSPPGLLVDTGFAALNGTTNLMNGNYGDAAWNGVELGLNFAGAAGSGKLMSTVRAEQAALRLPANAERMASAAFAQDMAEVGVTSRQIELMFAKELPLGFENVRQFAQFKTELDVSLRRAGLVDAEVGLKGTATTFYSENPGKLSGHYWDRDPLARGDYDLNVTSPMMVNKLQSSGIMPSEKYGVFKTADMQRSFGPLDEFRQNWSKTLGRDVNFVGYPAAQTRDATEYILRARK